MLKFILIMLIIIVFKSSIYCYQFKFGKMIVKILSMFVSNQVLFISIKKANNYFNIPYNSKNDTNVMLIKKIYNHKLYCIIEKNSKYNK
jgi:hypothetical protein